MINILDGQSLSNFVLLQLQFSLHTKARRMFGNGKVMASVLIKHLHESCQIFIKADKALLACVYHLTFALIPLFSHSHTNTHYIHTCLSSTALCKFFFRFALPVSYWMQLRKMTFSTENSSHFPSCTKLILNMLAQSSPPLKDFTLFLQARTYSSITWSHGIKLFSFIKLKYNWFTRLY